MLLVSRSETRLMVTGRLTYRSGLGTQRGFGASAYRYLGQEEKDRKYLKPSAQLPERFVQVLDRTVMILLA